MLAGRDAFHRIPGFVREAWVAVEHDPANMKFSALNLIEKGSERTGRARRYLLRGQP